MRFLFSLKKFLNFIFYVPTSMKIFIIFLGRSSTRRSSCLFTSQVEVGGYCLRVPFQSFRRHYTFIFSHNFSTDPYSQVVGCPLSELPRIVILLTFVTMSSETVSLSNNFDFVSLQHLRIPDTHFAVEVVVCRDASSR